MFFAFHPQWTIFDHDKRRIPTPSHAMAWLSVPQTWLASVSIVRGLLPWHGSLLFSACPTLLLKAHDFVSPKRQGCFRVRQNLPLIPNEASVTDE